MKQNKLEYFINLNERGSFYADVRRDGKTIYEIWAGNELKEDETSIFEDGFMKNPRDLSGLTEYLNDLGLIQANDSSITFGN